MNAAELHDQADAVETRDDLVRFLHAFADDLSANPGDWENANLPDFLEALARSSGSMQNYYVNTGQPVPDTPSWRTFADMLMAARIYE